jgi:hypothetical protein
VLPSTGAGPAITGAGPVPGAGTPPVSAPAETWPSGLVQEGVPLVGGNNISGPPVDKPFQGSDAVIPSFSAVETFPGQAAPDV